MAGAADAATIPIPSFQIGVDQADGPEDVAVVLQVIALLTVLSLAPAIMILMTSFTRLVIVFHFLRQAHRYAAESPQPGGGRAGALYDLFYHDPGVAAGIQRCAHALYG